MSKEDPGDIKDGPIPMSVGRITFQEVYKILIDTNTVNVDFFHPVAYAANRMISDTPILHKVLHGTYREQFIDATKDNIDTLQKKKMWYIVFQFLFQKGRGFIKSIW